LLFSCLYAKVKGVNRPRNVFWNFCVYYRPAAISGGLFTFIDRPTRRNQ